MPFDLLILRYPHRLPGNIALFLSFFFSFCVVKMRRNKTLEVNGEHYHQLECRFPKIVNVVLALTCDLSHFLVVLQFVFSRCRNRSLINDDGNGNQNATKQ